MPKTNKQKKAEFVHLLTNILDGLDDFPKPLKMLAKTAAKQIDENKIDSILDGTLDFLAQAYSHIEAIKVEEMEIEVDVIPNPRDKQLRLTG